MKEEKARGPGFQDMAYRNSDQLDRFVFDFLGGKPLHWPVVPRAKLKRVWSDFVRDGYVRDEEALESIFSTIRDNVVRLRIATIVAGHDTYDPASYLEHLLDPEEIQPFVDWLVDYEGGWRISDHGLGPLEDAVALAFEARTSAAKLKYLDRALHVTHMRGDLSLFFVEGGRHTVVDLDDCDEAAAVQEDVPGQPDVSSNDLL
jgi:hypothetical protein